MWRAVRRFGHVYTPHRTLEQESSISIAIVKARDYKDIINAVNSPSTKLGNITFGFRILSRFLKVDKRTKHVVKEELFGNMMNAVRENIDDLDSQGICDIFFWVRTSHLHSVVTFTRNDMSRLINRAEKLIDSSSFNSKQLLNLYYDMSHTNYYSHRVEAKIEELLNNRNEILNHVDFHTLLLAISKSNRPMGKKLARATIDRIILSNFSNLDIQVLSGYLSILPNQFKRFQINPKLADLIDKLKEILLNNLSHIAPSESKFIIEFYENFPKQDTLLFEECIKRQFSLLQTNPSNFTFSHLKYLAGFTTSLNRSSLPLSCPPEMKHLIKDVIINKLKNRKDTEFIYELVCGLGMLGMRLNPEDQQTVLGSFLDKDRQGLYPFHFARMLFRAGIEDVDFLFKVKYILGF